MDTLRHGRIFIILGLMHTAVAVSPLAFGRQFASFAQQGFFQVSDGLLEFPFLGGDMHYESFASFWFFYFGLLLLLLGALVLHIGKQGLALPKSFSAGYLALVTLGAYMIPLSGMTFLMLPHALMLVVAQARSKERDPTQQREL